MRSRSAVSGHHHGTEAPDIRTMCHVQRRRVRRRLIRRFEVAASEDRRHGVFRGTVRQAIPLRAVRCAGGCPRLSGARSGPVPRAAQGLTLSSPTNTIIGDDRTAPAIRSPRRNPMTHIEDHRSADRSRPQSADEAVGEHSAPRTVWVRPDDVDVDSLFEGRIVRSTRPAERLVPAPRRRQRSHPNRHYVGDRRDSPARRHGPRAAAAR